MTELAQPNIGQPPLSRTATLVAAIATITLVGIGLSLSVALLAIRMEEAGYSSAAIGLSTSVSGLANVIGAPVVPRLARMFGVQGLLYIAIGVGAITLLTFSATPIGLWIALRFVFGAALAILFVMSEFWIVSASPAQRRGLITGIYATCLALGFAAGPAILGLTGTSGSLPFWTGAALMLLGLVPVAVAGRSTPAVEKSAKLSLLVLIRTVPLATAAAFVFGVFETASMSLFPVYALRLDLSAGVGAALISCAALGNVVFQIPLGLAGDRLSRRVVLLFCGLSGVLGALGMMLVGSNVVGLCLVVFLWGGLTAGLYTVGLALIGDRFKGAELAAASGAVVMLYSVGLVVGPPVLGQLMDWRLSGLPLGLLTLFALYVVLASYKLLKTRWSGRET
ncbi:MFS transporter [Lichenihabitans psoromatis]|uniref:MFS transporter n=1 Tax=Lichenihabitans psoromatis TaxID=2528642 RepID=UPI0013F152BC|nr:MFS transporter [Lichenihabitans psoromatis]